MCPSSKRQLHSLRCFDNNYTNVYISVVISPIHIFQQMQITPLEKQVKQDQQDQLDQQKTIVERRQSHKLQS